MRGAPAVLALGLAAVAIGCGSPPGAAFSTGFPPIDGDPIGSIDIKALPVTLHDATGTVTGIAVGELRPEDNLLDLPRGHAESVPNKPNRIRFLWMGGACEREVVLALSAIESQNVLRIHAESSISILGGGCPALGVNRSVIVEFNQPVDPADFDVRTDNEN